MKANEIRVMSDAQLVERTDELLEEWRQLRFDQAVGRLQHTKRISQIRRDVARIKTIQTEREMDRALAAAMSEATE